MMSKRDYERKLYTTKIAPWDKHYLFKEIYSNWLEIVFPNGDDRLKRLDKKSYWKVKAIKNGV